MVRGAEVSPLRIEAQLKTIESIEIGIANNKDILHSLGILAQKNFTPRRAYDNQQTLVAQEEANLKSAEALLAQMRQEYALDLQGTETHAITYECGGPRVYSYEEFLRAVAHEAGLKPMLIPIPFAAWHALAWISEMLPSPPVTRNQVELMQVDTVSSPEIPGFGQLGISPHSVEEILQEILWDH